MEIFKTIMQQRQWGSQLWKELSVKGHVVIIFQSWQPLYNLMEQKTELFIVIVSLMMAAEVSINLVFIALS